MLTPQQIKRREKLIESIQNMDEMPEWTQAQSNKYEVMCNEYNELERERIHA